MQSLIVALLVGACSAYALWTLMPSGARRALATAMLRIPHLPGRIDKRLRKVAQAASACGCDGCDRSEKKAAPHKTITIHPRPPR